MRAPAFVLEYHGCDERVGERVLANKQHLLASENDYDWLGTGIYFWENSVARAQAWAQNPRISRNRIKNPFVVGAVIDLGNCLDLLEAESIGTVERSFRDFEESSQLLEIPIPRNEAQRRSLDCAVINYVHLMREQEGEQPFDSVRAAFVEGSPIYENAGFHRKTHIQVCLRTPKQIVGYFRPIQQ